jgi:hypothetical protein
MSRIEFQVREIGPCFIFELGDTVMLNVEEQMSFSTSPSFLVNLRLVGDLQNRSLGSRAGAERTLHRLLR